VPSGVQAGMNALHFTRWALAGAFAAGASLSGCTTQKAPQVASHDSPSTDWAAGPSTIPTATPSAASTTLYDTVEQVLAVPPGFNANDGKVFVIGDPGSKPIVVHLLRSLEKGRTYALPAAFVEYQKGHAKEEK
jgi:hypothetical protein